jgi:opine dehydrogenase
MRIAVIGGGHGCYAAAAHLSELGHAVRMWRRDADAFGPVLANRRITLTDARGTRQVDIALPTTDLGEAVRGAELIVMPLPCTTHAALAPQIAPLFEDGQIVYLPPGTFGGYIFAKAAKDAGNGAELAFAETGTLPYLARKQAVDQVRISVYATRLPTGVFPARMSESALAVIARAYAATEPLSDLMDAALMNAGPIIHPPLIMMNAGPLEHFDAWDIHNEGTQPAIRRVTDALDGERVALRRALGYGAPHFPLADHYDDSREEWMYGDSSHESLTDSGDWREHIDLSTHRYMREDTALGLSFLVSVGRRAGVATPLASGLLAIASAIVGQDLYAGGRTLEALGLDRLDDAAWRRLMRDGLGA